MPTNITLLSLPVEIRLQIYNHVLSTSSTHSLRPQRKIGWNRPHADLANPSLLFECDAPVALKQLFHSRLTKGDHALILEAVLHHARILVVDHVDFMALIKVARLPSTSSTNTSSGQSRLSLVTIVKENIRTLDFSDRMDETVCQPNDVVKLIRGLPGLRTVHMTSKHVQRYSGTIDEHVDFARERAAREQNCLQNSLTTSMAGSTGLVAGDEHTGVAINTGTDIDNTAAELRRLTLRSPMTDGTRMMISPAIFNRSLPTRRAGGNDHTHVLKKEDTAWVVVDLSMIVWQHFLYTGAPYRDHWRTIKMTTLLEVAESQNVHIVMNFRNIEFDPLRHRNSSGHGNTSHHHNPHDQQGLSHHEQTRSRPSTPRRQSNLQSGTFKGEMSTLDWTLNLRQIQSGRGSGPEYTVRQRKVYDQVVAQDGCGLVKCRHSQGCTTRTKRGSIGVSTTAGAICDECVGVGAGRV